MAYSCQHCGRQLDTCSPVLTQQGEGYKREVQVFCNEECNALYVVAEAGNGPLCRVCKAPQCSKRCADCHYTYYCGAACQRRDWRAHKNLCRNIVAMKNGGIPTEACVIEGGVEYTSKCFSLN